MKRAAIIIGVNKTGDLPELHDAVPGALLMEAWARAQNMHAVHVFTDLKNPVHIHEIKTVIRDLIQARNISQLVVYFAGHGINKERNEYWLLSGAPDDPQEAVNVTGSMALATTCGIPHIVLISDACRTAPEGIRAQSIRGSEIFPNREEEEVPVDVFYACQLGRPSHEVKDPNVTSAEFSALYTNELVPALHGRRGEIVEWKQAGEKNVGRIHLRPLRDFMSAAVAGRLQDLKLQTKVIQVPVARIISDPPAWISEFSIAATDGGVGALQSLRPARKPPPRTTADLNSDLLHGVLSGGAGQLRTDMDSARRSGIAGSEALMDSVGRIFPSFGPTHHETGCGFKIRGSRIITAHSRRAKFDFPDGKTPPGETLRVTSKIEPGENFLLVLEQGRGVLLPAIPDYITALTIEDGELVDVAYEPSDNRPQRWKGYAERMDEFRALRAIASASMAQGAFRLEGNNVNDVAKRIRHAQGIDPTLALYAAYGYHDLQRFDLIRDIREHMWSDLGAPLFDVALLSKSLNGTAVGANSQTLGAVPLLSQGWALLSAYKVALPETLQALQDHLLPSLWTMFGERGVEHARHAIQSGDIK